MIIFFIGNVGSLRRGFRAAASESVVSLDNDDVVADFMLNGKVYFVVGKIPCANMCIAEYVAYSRALKTRLPLGVKGCRDLLKKSGYRASMTRKLGSLDRVTYRKIQLAAKLDASTHSIYVNFDGIPYSRMIAAKIKKLLNKWGKKWQVNAGFADCRFLPKKAVATVYLPDGTAKGFVNQRSKQVHKGYLKRALSRQGLQFKWAGVTQVVRSDN